MERTESARNSARYLMEALGWDRAELSKNLGLSKASLDSSMSKQRDFSQQTRQGIALLLRLHLPNDNLAKAYLRGLERASNG